MIEIIDLPCIQNVVLKLCLVIHCRGLPNMLHVVVNEIATWPEFLQTVFGYVQRPTVIVPFVALLW